MSDPAGPEMADSEKRYTQDDMDLAKARVRDECVAIAERHTTAIFDQHSKGYMLAVTSIANAIRESGRDQPPSRL